jgi:hypothetical protein
MTDPGPPRFEPAFAMPVIAPAPAGYSGSVADYYAEMATQTLVTPTPVELLPEQLLNPAGPFQTKGVLITIANPDASFQPAVPIPPPPIPFLPVPLPAFGILYAMLGGELQYQPSGDPGGLNPLLPAAFAQIASPIHYPPPADLITPTWGTLALRVWATDAKKIQDALPGEPACRMIYYVGVDQASLKSMLEPTVKRMYDEQAFLDYVAAQDQKPVAEQKFAPLRDAAKAITLIVDPDPPPSATPTYATLVDRILDAFVAGTTRLLVKGGTPIGKAIQINTPNILGPATTARVEMWFVDETDQFFTPGRLIAGAPSYDF